MRLCDSALRSRFIQAASANLSWSANLTSPEGAHADPFKSSTETAQQALEKNTDKIVYSVSREEAIEALNKTLSKSTTSETTASDITASDALGTNFQEGRGQESTGQESAGQASLERAHLTAQGEHGTQYKPKQLVDLSDVAYLARLRGDYREAERLYKQGLIRQRKTLGEADPKVATILRSLAGLYTLQSRHSEAETLLKEALTIQHQQLCTGHLETGETIYRLASCYRHQERYGDADDLFQKALAIFRQQLGVDNPRTQSVYNDFMQMMTMLIEEGKFTELNTHLPPLDLNTLSDTYSWAKPAWAKGDRTGDE